MARTLDLASMSDERLEELADEIALLIDERHRLHLETIRRQPFLIAPARLVGAR